MLIERYTCDRKGCDAVTPKESPGRNWRASLWLYSLYTEDITKDERVFHFCSLDCESIEFSNR